MKTPRPVHRACGFVLTAILFCNLLAAAESEKIAGTVLLPDGSPLAGATVMVCATSYTCTNLESPAFAGAAPPTQTADENGSFSFPKPPTNYTLAVIHEKGFGEISGEGFVTKQQIIVQPWARAEGLVKIGAKPAPQEAVVMERGGWTGPHLTFSLDRPEADAQGRFVFEKVPPVIMRFGRMIQREMDSGYSTGAVYSSSHWSLVDVAPGATFQVQVGGIGRPVVGRLTEPEGYKGKIALSAGDWVMINSEMPATRDRASMLASRHFTFQINRDGTFRVEDVPPGRYEVSLNVHTALQREARPNPARRTDVRRLKAIRDPRNPWRTIRRTIRPRRHSVATRHPQTLITHRSSFFAPWRPSCLIFLPFLHFKVR